MDELLFTPNEVFGLIGLSVILGIILILPASREDDDGR